DRVYTAPEQDAAGNYLDCDPGGGPYVEMCKVMEIMGDKTALVAMRIRFTYSDCARFVLDNRWSVRAEVDGQTHLTTRTAEGQAFLRLDYLQSTEPALQADQFRAAFVLPPPPGFIRKRIRVEATPDGRSLRYVVVDQETWLRLGSSSPALRINGHF